MLIVVLTGGLGAGKSTAARYFAARGALVIDADDVANRVLSEDRGLRRRLAKVFGRDVLGPNDAVDRAALAARAFADADSARKLNEIVHPAVVESLRSDLAALRASESPPRVVIVEVPLLAEAPAIADLADRVLALEAPVATRVARSVARGMSEWDAEARIARQAADEERARIADDRILNDGSTEDLDCALAAYWEMLGALEAH